MIFFLSCKIRLSNTYNLNCLILQSDAYRLLNSKPVGIHISGIMNITFLICIQINMLIFIYFFE